MEICLRDPAALAASYCCATAPFGFTCQASARMLAQQTSCPAWAGPRNSRVARTSPAPGSK
eukprot:13889919-Alexandrium_andersonii.AAC.1